MFTVDSKPYRADSLAFSPKEIELRDFYSVWLPKNIIDCHAHSGKSEDIDYMEKKTYKHMLSTFPSLTIEESMEMRSLFHPEKKIRSLRFAKTFRGVNHRKVNEYLIESSPDEDRIALFGLPEDPIYTKEMLHHPRVSALKMYYSYVEPSATKIYDFFTPTILETAEVLGIPIILHLPRSYVDCMPCLREMFRDFPRLKISIAHLGPSDFIIDGLEDAFRESSEYPYLSLDTSLNNSSEVISLAFNIFGVGRIMYGSDEPLNLIRGRVYDHPEKGGRLITSYPYHWINEEDHERFSYLAKDSVHWHWVALDALRKAIDSIGLKEDRIVKEQVFHDNAENFFGF